MRRFWAIFFLLIFSAVGVGNTIHLLEHEYSGIQCEHTSDENICPESSHGHFCDLCAVNHHFQDFVLQSVVETGAPLNQSVKKEDFYFLQRTKTPVGTLTSRGPPIGDC